MLPTPKLFFFPAEIRGACSHHNFHEEKKRTSGAVFAKMAKDSVKEEVGEGRSQHALTVPTVAPFGEVKSPVRPSVCSGLSHRLCENCRR